MSNKERVDILAVNQSLFPSREQAKRAIMAGIVLGKNGERIDKPGQKIDVDTELKIKGEKLKYVSRGGLKLEKAINEFNIDLTDKIVLDIGSSTGGFTDVSLQNNARLVYALDVGTNQLVWELRNNPKVVVMENTNFRYSKLEDFKDGQPEFSCIDVSFISLELILPSLRNILKDGGHVVALIKPQFEAGRENVGKNGIIKDPNVHKDVLKKVFKYITDNGFSLEELTYSPIKGGHGNIEFLSLLRKDENPIINNKISIEKILDETYKNLNE